MSKDNPHYNNVHNEGLWTTYYLRSKNEGKNIRVHQKQNILVFYLEYQVIQEKS